MVPPPAEKARRLMQAAVVGVLSMYVIGALAIYPSIDNDPADGFRVHKSMRAGAAWNHIIEVDRANIAVDTTYFLTAWSPGQHAVPQLFRALGFSLGAAVTITKIVGGVLAIVGWYLLFRALHFDRVTVMAAVLLLTASRATAIPFITYNGSDQLAFAVFPYLAWWLWAARRTWMLPMAAISLMVAFFFKNSAAINLLAWIGAVTLTALWAEPRSRRQWAITAATVATSLASLWLINVAYVSRGWSPIQYKPAWSEETWKYVMPSAMTVLTGTGLDHLLTRVFEPVSGGGTDYRRWLLLTLPVAIGAAAWVVWEMRQRVQHETRVAIALFLAAIVCVLTALFATGVDVPLSRHYLIAGALLLVLLVSRLRQLTRPVAAVAFMVLALPAVYGVASFGSNWYRHYAGRDVHSDEMRVLQLPLTPRMLHYVRALDANLPDGSVIAVPIVGLSLELSRTRAISPTMTSVPEELSRKRTWYGRVDNIVVMVEQATQTPGAIRGWLDSFASYPSGRWRAFAAEGFAFYVPDGQAVDPAWLESQYARTRVP